MKTMLRDVPRCGEPQAARRRCPRAAADVCVRAVLVGAALLSLLAPAAPTAAALTPTTPTPTAVGDLMTFRDRLAVSAVCPAALWNVSRRQPFEKRGYLFGISGVQNASAPEVGAGRRVCVCVGARGCACAARACRAGVRARGGRGPDGRRARRPSGARRSPVPLVGVD